LATYRAARHADFFSVTAVNVAVALLRRGSLSKDGKRRCRDFPRLDALLRTKPGSRLSHPRLRKREGNKMSEVLEHTIELPLDTAAKRALIESELQKDAGRSDREIARIIGCDHKTVSARRREMGLAPPLGNSPASSSAEESVDNAIEIADGKVGASAADDMVNVEFPLGNVRMRRDQAVAVQAAMDQCAGIRLRDRTARLQEADAVGEKNQECTILPRRHEVTIQHDPERGEWILKQRNWPDDDSLITISDEDINEFVDILTNHLGYGRAP
jgi:hypothetical protein